MDNEPENAASVWEGEGQDVVSVNPEKRPKDSKNLNYTPYLALRRMSQEGDVETAEVAAAKDVKSAKSFQVPMSLPDVASTDGLERSRLFPFLNDRIPTYERLDDVHHASKNRHLVKGKSDGGMVQISVHQPPDNNGHTQAQLEQPQSNPLLLDETGYMTTLEHAERLGEHARLMAEKNMTRAERRSAAMRAREVDMSKVEPQSSVPSLSLIRISSEKEASFFHLTQIALDGEHDVESSYAPKSVSVHSDMGTIDYENLVLSLSRRVTFTNARNEQRFFKHFNSEDGKEIMSRSFRICFFVFFEQDDLLGAEVMDLISGVSYHASHLFWNIDRRERDQFWINYPIALAYIVAKHFKESSKLAVSDHFEMRVHQILSELITGVRMKKSTLLKLRSKLFNKALGRKKTRRLRRQSAREKMQSERFVSLRTPRRTKDHRNDLFDSSDDSDDSTDIETDARWMFRNDIENIVRAKDEDLIEEINNLGSDLYGSTGITSNMTKERRISNEMHVEQSNSQIEKHNNDSVLQEGENKNALPYLTGGTKRGYTSNRSNKQSTEKCENREKKSWNPEAHKKRSPRFDTMQFQRLMQQLRASLDPNRNYVKDNPKFWNPYSTSPLIGLQASIPAMYYNNGKSALIKSGKYPTNMDFTGSVVDEEHIIQAKVRYHKLWTQPNSQTKFSAVKEAGRSVSKRLAKMEEKTKNRLRTIDAFHRDVDRNIARKYRKILTGGLNGENTKTLLKEVVDESKKKNFSDKQFENAFLNNISLMNANVTKAAAQITSDEIKDGLKNARAKINVQRRKILPKE